MKKSIAFAWMLSVALIAAFASAAAKPKTVSASRANGTYRSQDNVIQVLWIDATTLKVSFDLTNNYKTPTGEPTSSSGAAMGVAKLAGETAIFATSELGSPCSITLQFIANNQIKVTQDSDSGACGFSSRTSAAGTYRRTKSGKPKFPGSQEAATPSPPVAAVASRAPAMTMMTAKEVGTRFGRDSDEAMRRQPEIAASIKRLYPAFEQLGMPGDNQAVQLDGGAVILLLCGREPRAMGQAQFFVAYDETRKVIYFTRIDFQEEKSFGTADATMKAALDKLNRGNCP